MSATPTAADRARAIAWWDAMVASDAPATAEDVERELTRLATSYAEVRAEAVAHERERAARVCEATRDGLAGCNDCAAAIRAGESA